MSGWPAAAAGFAPPWFARISLGFGASSTLLPLFPATSMVLEFDKREKVGTMSALLIWPLYLQLAQATQ